MQQVPRGTKRASRSTKFVYPQQVPRGRISSCYTCGVASKKLVAEGLGLGDGAEAAVDDLRQ